MSAKDFEKAIVAVLRPAGFVRVRRSRIWLRERAGFLEEVNLQTARFALEVTVNYAARFERARRIVTAVAGHGKIRLFYTIDGRIGDFLGPYDRWWNRDEADGPAQVAELIETKLLPYFDAMETVDPYVEQVTRQYLGGRWRNVTPVLELALLLHERGEVDRARRILTHPPERIEPEEMARVAAVRDYLFGPDSARS